MSSTSDLLTKTYAAFNARDIAAVLTAMHPDVDWPNGWEGGRVRGHKAVREYWTRQWQAVNPHVESVEITEAEAGDEQVVTVLVHQVVRDLAGTVLFDGTVRHVYQMEDGLVRRMDIEDAAD